jgi:hypothetical protein
MPAGYDAEVAELFRDLRSASSLSEADLAARLATRVEVVQALEQGALYALPPWAETCRVVNGYGAMLNLDVRPLLRRIYAQLEAGIVELSPKPIPDVPTMATPEPADFGLDQGPFAANKNPFDTNSFEANAFQANSFAQKPPEPGKSAAAKPAQQTPDWPENPFAKPSQPQAVPRPSQPQAPPQAQPQWPQAQPAPSLRQNAWPKGPGTPLQAGWPNAAPQAPPQPMPQGARPNAPSPQQPQAPWTGNSGAPQRPTPQVPQGQGQPRPQQQRPPQQAKMPPQPPRPAPQPQVDASFDRDWPQPAGPKHPTEADLEAAWQQPGQPKPQARPRPQAAAPPPPLPVEEPEKPKRKRALLKWGIVLLLLAIMAVGGWLVLGHFKGEVGFKSSKPAALDPDDPRSHKADKLPSPAQGPS